MHGWTEERRKKRSKLTRLLKPWMHSTGPKTVEGKAISSQNARKHGLRSRQMIEIMKQFSELSKEEVAVRKAINKKIPRGNR